MKNALCIMVVMSAACQIVIADTPLPLHQTEGNSGVFLTSTAYLANPAKEPNIFGLPSMSTTYAGLKDKDYESIAITQNILGNFEVGFAYERLGLGDWPSEVKDATGMSTQNHVDKYNLNLRHNFIKEGSFDMEWMPAVTFGTHFKWNASHSDINRDLNGTCDSLGADHGMGTEFTLVASKTIKNVIGRPAIISAGIRNGDAIHTGLLGFAGERRTTFEGSFVLFLTDKLLFATEYRQKSDLADKCVVGSETLVGSEDDWYDFCLAYLVNDHLTVSGGYANFGQVLEDKEDGVLALQMKYEF